MKKFLMNLRECKRAHQNQVAIMKYEPLITSNTKQKHCQNIKWFNPPFSRNVSTNVAKTFLQLLDKHFPPSKSLHKIKKNHKIT